MKKVIFILCLVLFGGGQSSEWNVIGEMPFPVYNGKALVYNSRIYIFGGYSALSNSPTDTIQVFDPETGIWGIAGTMQSPRAGLVADVYKNNILIFGGTSGDTTLTDNVETWDFGTDATNNFAINDTTNRVNAAGGVHDSSFYILGGYTEIVESDSIIPYILEYQLEGKTTQFHDNAFNSPNTQVPYQQMVALHENDFYIFGGVFFVPTKNVFKFNVVTKQLEQIYPGLLVAQAGGEAVTGPENSIYLIGGYNESDPAMNDVVVFFVDDFGYTLQSGAELNYGRNECMAINYMDSLIYVFGGVDENNELVPFIETLNFTTWVTDVENKASTAKTFKLEQNYPNPFNAQTRISFELEKSQRAELVIYDIRGRQVKVLVADELSRGYYQYTWDGTDDAGNPASSDIYFYQLTTENSKELKKMVLVK